VRLGGVRVHLLGSGEVEMIGRRIDNPEGLPQPGDYGKQNGHRYACAPRRVSPSPNDAHNLFVASLAGHDIVEHEDGTITVSPSILIHRHDGEWHGYLEKGIWREV
jgi:hypothetical protein